MCAGKNLLRCGKILTGSTCNPYGAEKPNRMESGTRDGSWLTEHWKVTHRENQLQLR